MIRFIAVLLASSCLAPATVSEAGLFRRTDGSWRTPVRTFVANRAAAREARGAVALFHRVRAAATAGNRASGSCSSCAAPQAVDCPECVVAEGIAAAANARRDRLDLGIFRLASQLSRRQDLTSEQRSAVRRLLVDREARLALGEALQARYGVGEGTLLQILQFILQNREDIKELIKMILEIMALF